MAKRHDSPTAKGRKLALGAFEFGCLLLAASSPPAFGTARPEAAVQDATFERLLSGDDLGRAGTRTRPQADADDRQLCGTSADKVNYLGVCCNRSPPPESARRCNAVPPWPMQTCTCGNRVKSYFRDSVVACGAALAWSRAGAGPTRVAARTARSASAPPSRT